MKNDALHQAEQAQTIKALTAQVEEWKLIATNNPNDNDQRCQLLVAKREAAEKRADSNFEDFEVEKAKRVAAESALAVAREALSEIEQRTRIFRDRELNGIANAALALLPAAPTKAEPENRAMRAIVDAVEAKAESKFCGEHPGSPVCPHCWMCATTGCKEPCRNYKPEATAGKVCGKCNGEGFVPGHPIDYGDGPEAMDVRCPVCRPADKTGEKP